MDVEPNNGLELASAVGRELGDHCERASRVDNHVQAVVATRTDICWIEVTARLVTYAGLAALCAFAKVVAGYIASMWCEMSGPGVGLKYVDFIAACSVAFDVWLVYGVKICVKPVRDALKGTGKIREDHSPRH